jgi:hypothetical protein
MGEKEKEQVRGLDELVGFVRGNEPLLVSECIQAKNRESMIWYFGGYCLCSRFYKCRFQSDGVVIMEGKERAVCCKYGSP